MARKSGAQCLTANYISILMRLELNYREGPVYLAELPFHLLEAPQKFHQFEVPLPSEPLQKQYKLEHGKKYIRKKI